MSNETASRLKDLGEADFETRYGCDRFTASVLASRYRYIVKHMCTHLMTNAFSSILREWYDFAATLSGPAEVDYAMPAVSDSLVIFTGTMPEAVRNVVEEYGAKNLRPGDVLMCNDPIRTGTHVNDVLMVRPVFRDSRLVGLVNLKAHMIDMGGIVPGGFSPKKQNSYENGLVIPPMLLFRDDEPIRSSFSLIFDNTRFGAVMLPDFLSMAACLRLGERLVGETIGRYGVNAYLGAIRYATDVSAEALADALRGVPDGEYIGEDVIDCDAIDDLEEYLIHVAVRIAGARVEVDFSGSSRQARTCINAGWLDTKMAAGVALKYLLEPSSPFTSGVYRGIDVVVPQATVMCAMPPEAAIMLNFEVSNFVINAIFRALAPAVGENAIGGDLGGSMAHLATGVRASGVPWAAIGTVGGENGPWGATRHADGEGGLTLYTSNCIAPAVETVESDAPVVILRREYATDSSGAGENRGGAAILKDTLWLSDSDHYPNITHVKRPPTGVRGGREGTSGAAWFWPGNGEIEPAFTGTDAASFAAAEPVSGVLDPETNMLDPSGTYVHYGSRDVWKASPGARFRYRTGGGGGFGDPLARAPERVLRDVRDEYVSIRAAREVYGVVVVGDPVADPEGLRIDTAATAALRAEPGNG